MPSATASSISTSSKIVAAKAAEGNTTTDPQDSSSSSAVESDLTKEESLLKEYSKELYVYTLDLLNSVRIDNAHKGVNGKALMLKRTISDIAVPLKTMEIGGGSSDASKGTKGAAAPA